MASSFILNRRRLLGGAAAVAAGGLLLDGCGSDRKKNNNTVNTKVKLPSYHPYAAIKPDLPGDPKVGVQDGYLHFPSHLVRGIKDKPGRGGSVSALVITYTNPPPPVGRNKYWQELNNRLGSELKLQIVPFEDYVSKVATTVAGGDLPDYLQIYGSVPQLPSLLAAKCQDLTEFLSGDAAADYPFLANIPADYWRSCIYNGGIYGLPISRSKMGSMLFQRTDLIKGVNADPAPSSFAEFAELCKEATDLKHNRWALASAPTSFVQQMLGASPGWRNDGGKLTNINEEPETKEALAATAKLVKAGYVHPDSFAQNNTTTLKEWFNAGNAVMHYDGATAWPGFYQQNVVGAALRINGVIPANYDSNTKAVTWQGGLDYSFTAIKKSSKDRVEELLRIANYLASPLGTEENLFLGNGIKGRDFTFQHGLPTKTDTGTAEVALSTGYIAQGPFVLSGQYTQATKDCYEFEKKFLPLSQADPTQGLYSDTSSSKSATLGDALRDAQYAILQGRKPVSSWDEAVRDWRNNGGDTIRKEFEEALQRKG
ncbi:MAG TPA: extracellular solute-binding protein [Mycobacteriales bacterium]|nr:extracellular solute-binding protein [Mycobacteriales bacterium]